CGRGLWLLPFDYW
nr:immunoglobulin heavy chain junction region [Mus musculus]